jgi:hypothetical protein
MLLFWISLAGWVVVLALFGLYVPRIRHPGQKPFAAYLIFVIVFTAVAIGMFVLLAYLAAAFGLAQALERPLPILIFLAGVFVPAFVVARWQARKPPRQPPSI